MTQDIDPKRSQIHNYLSDSPLHNSVAYDLFYFDRYQTIYYDALAGWIYDLEDEQLEQYGKGIEDLVNAVYKDGDVITDGSLELITKVGSMKCTFDEFMDRINL